MINELKEILKKEAEQNGDMKKVKEIEEATTFYHLGYSFQDAIKKLKEANVPIVMTQDEKTRRRIEIRLALGIREEGVNNTWAYENGLTNGRVNTEDFESTSDFIMVHKTDYAPKNGRIESNMSAGAKEEIEITLGGETYKGTRKKPRNSVHLSTNHEVADHLGGSWSKKKYAVLLPFDDLRKHSVIKGARAVDTFTEGPVQLTENSYILCPKGEGPTIQKENPNVTVIEYEGEVVQDYANMLVSLLGYHVEDANEHGFDNEAQHKRHYEIMNKEGFSFPQHSSSEYKKEEVRFGKIFSAVGVLDLISREKLIDKLGKEQLIEELKNKNLVNLLHAGFFIPEGHSELIDELKEIGINISFDEHEKVFKSHLFINAVGVRELDMSGDNILLGYMLDAVEERDKRLMAEKAEEGKVEAETKSIVEDEINTDQTSESEETNNEEEETEEQVEEDGNSGSKKEEDEDDDEDGWSM